MSQCLKHIGEVLVDPLNFHVAKTWGIIYENVFRFILELSLKSTSDSMLTSDPYKMLSIKNPCFSRFGSINLKST